MSKKKSRERLKLDPIVESLEPRILFSADLFPSEGSGDGYGNANIESDPALPSALSSEPALPVQVVSSSQLPLKSHENPGLTDDTDPDQGSQYPNGSTNTSVVPAAGDAVFYDHDTESVQPEKLSNSDSAEIQQGNQAIQGPDTAQVRSEDHGEYFEREVPTSTIDLSSQSGGESTVEPVAGAAENSPGEAAEQIDPAQSPVDHPVAYVFMDAAVEDAESLLSGLRENGDPELEWRVIRLDGDADGVGQITTTLADASGVDAIHLLSHGDGDGIKLGNAHLDLNTGGEDSAEIWAWGQSLDFGADLLIYGCDLASTGEGRELIEIISHSNS